MANLLEKASILITPTAYDNGSINAIKPKESPFGDLDFTRATSGSVVGTANRENANGVLEEVAENVPRIDYTGGVGHWLIEPESRNLFEHSEDFADSYWTKASSGNGSAPIVTSNYATSPDGSQNATRIQFDASTSGSGTDRSRFQRNSISVLDGEDYTQSFYLKSTNGTNQTISFLMDNSKVTTLTITSDWQRFDFTNTQSGTSGNYGLQLRSSDASTSDILAYGGQLEQKSYATSYIPTNGSTVTRAEDLANNSGNSDLINSTEGVLYAEIAALQNDGTTRRITLSDGSISNRVSLEFDEISNKIKAFISSSGTTKVLEYDATDLTVFNKIAIKYKTNDMSIFFNGSEVDVETIGNSPIGLDVLNLNQGSGSQHFFGKAKCIAVFKEALTDSELTCITT